MPKLLPAGSPLSVASVPRPWIVVGYATCSVAGWLLGIVGVTHLPSRGYVALDLGLELLIVVGLWLGWRAMWFVAIGLTLLGGILIALHPTARAALLIIGLIQLGLLLHPQLLPGTQRAALGGVG